MLLNFSEKFHRVLEDARLSLENTEAGCTLSLSLFFKIQFYLFLPVLGLPCCTPGFSTCRKRGLATLQLLNAVVALAADLWAPGRWGFGSCSKWAQ